MGIEFELKFRTDPQTLQAMRQTISGEETVFQMETTYYDTPDGALSRRHYTLRRRMENANSVCTLKTPADGLGRREFEWNCPSVEEAIPKLCKLSGIADLPDLLKDGVTAVCGARFTRIAKTVKLPGCIVELALDSGVLIGGGREQPLCEAEVELKSGSREAAVAYAMQLAAAFGLAQEKHSKFRRAQALAKGE